MKKQNQDNQLSGSAPRAIDGGLDPLRLLKEAIAAVPSMKYALAVVGLGAAVSLILTFVSDYLVAIIGFSVLVVFMVVLVVFQRLSVLEKSEFRYPALLLLWAFPLLTVSGAVLLFTSFFFSWPLALKPGDRSPERSEISTKASVVVSLEKTATPYRLYKLTSLPPPIETRYRGARVLPAAYFLQPELDLNAILFAVRVGIEASPQVFVSRDEFVTGENATETSKRERIWEIFSTIGSAFLEARLATTKPETQAVLGDLPSNPAEAGIAILRVVYYADKKVADVVIGTADQLLAVTTQPAALVNLQRAARSLATRRLHPVFILAVTNNSQAPIVLTGVQLRVSQVIKALSALNSGPLFAADSVRFELGAEPALLSADLDKPLKIAPKDAVAIRVELVSEYLFSYLCTLGVLSGSSVEAVSTEFLVDFGFQPPTDAVLQ